MRPPTGENDVATIQANDLRRGMNVYYNGAPCRVLEIEIRTPGKGRAFVQAKLRNILDGTQREVKFSTADQVDEASVESRGWTNFTATLMARCSWTSSRTSDDARRRRARRRESCYPRRCVG
jgi:hypothetical protein